MKICITSAGKSMDSQGDTRFGKAPCFLIIDTESMNYEFLDNPGKDGPKSGLWAARVMLEQGVEAVLSGCMGQNAQSVLRTGNIKVFEGLSGDESIRNAVETFKESGYRESSTS